MAVLQEGGAKYKVTNNLISMDTDRTSIKIMAQSFYLGLDAH